MSKRRLHQGDAPTLISNIEVLEFLQQRRRERKTRGRHSSHHRHRDWIEDQVVEYIQSTPCVKLDSSRRAELQSVLTSHKKVVCSSSSSSSRRHRSTRTTTTTGFGLTEAESYQILNSMPTEPVEVHLLIDELQSRMTERQQDELLVTIGIYMKDDDDDDVDIEAPAATRHGTKIRAGKKAKTESNVIKQENDNLIEDFAEV